MSLAGENVGFTVALIARLLIAQPAYLAYPTFVWGIRLLLSTKLEPNVRSQVDLLLS